MENKKLNENELKQVNGGTESGVCIKDPNNTRANQFFCSGCIMIRSTSSYSGRGKVCSCGNGVYGTWKE